MSATFEWKVISMAAYPQAEGQVDVVFQVNWACIGMQTAGEVTFTANATNVANVTYTAGSPYTPYNQLTQDQVLGWVWASGVDKDATQAALQQQIDAEINPPVIYPPLPWPQPPVPSA